MTLFKNRFVQLLLAIAAVLFIGGTVAASGAFPESFADFYARFTGDTVANSVDTPLEVTHGTTTITLREAYVIDAQTVIELSIEDPILPMDIPSLSQYSAMAPLGEMVMEGFETGEVNHARVGRYVPGQVSVRMDFPAPSGHVEDLMIEIPDFTLIRDVEGAQPNELIPLGGPWRFEFVPNMDIAQSEANTVPLRLDGRNDYVGIRIETLEQASNEWVATYRLLPPTHANTQWLGDVTVLVDDREVAGRRITGPPQMNENGYSDFQTVAFPAKDLSNQSNFTVAFGPFWVPDGEPLDLILDAKQLRSGGEEVLVKGFPLHFALDQTDVESPALVVRSVGEEPIPFTLIGPAGQLEIEDDTGHRYELLGDDIDLDPSSGMGMTIQRLLLSEPLSDEASQLTLRISTSGRVIDPIRIPVTMP